MLGQPPGVGQGGAAFKWNGNQMFTRIFDAQTQWSVNFDLMPFYQVGSSTLWAQDKFLQMSDPSGNNVLALEVETDGTIGVVIGGDGTSGTGTIVKRTTATFPVGIWATRLEVFAAGLGGSTTVTMFSNDVQILQVVTSTSFVPDRISIGSQNGTSGGVHAQPFFGLAYANIVYTDGQGSAPWNTRLGPVRVSGQPPNADVGGNWNITPNTVLNRYQAVNDIYPVDGSGSPDFDTTTIQPIALNSPQWFTVQGASCYGQVLGIMANVCLRGLSGSTTCDILLLQQTSQITVATLVFTGPVGKYRTKQAFQGLSLTSGTFFNDAEIAGALWGLSTASPGLIVTQFFLEKIVSLRTTPYNCGASSYGF